MYKELMAATLSTGLILGGGEAAMAMTNNTPHSTVELPHAENDFTPPRYVKGVGTISVASAFANNELKSGIPEDDKTSDTTLSSADNRENSSDTTAAINTQNIQAAKMNAAKSSLYNDFVKLSKCESGGDWSANTGNSFYGGLQFTKSSWLMAGGGKYAAYAHNASKNQQIEIAVKLKAMQGWVAWPVCSRKEGLR